jgi:hypothetical protein
MMARPRGEGPGKPRGEKEPTCVGKDCTITETEVYKLTDFYTYERNFHYGPVFTKGVSKAAKEALEAQAKAMGGRTDDCASGCKCAEKPAGQAPNWGPDENIDIFGQGSNGFVFFCRAKRRRREFKGICAARK